MKELKFDFFKITRSTTLFIILVVMLPLVFFMPIYVNVVSGGNILSNVNNGSFGFCYIGIASFMALFVTKDFSSKYFVNVHKNTNAFSWVLSKFVFGVLLVVAVLLVEFGAYCALGALTEHTFFNYIETEVDPNPIIDFNAAQWFTDYGLKVLSALAWMSVLTLLSVLCKREWIALIFGAGYPFACFYVYQVLNGLIGAISHVENYRKFQFIYSLLLTGTTSNAHDNTVHMFVLLGYIVVAFLLSWLCVWLRQNKGKVKQLQPQA